MYYNKQKLEALRAMYPAGTRIQLNSMEGEPNMKKEIIRLLYSKKIDDLLIYIEALSNSVEDEKEREKLITLHTYFTTNKDGLVSCHRRGLNLPEPLKGEQYRRMGTMESNIIPF